MSDDEIKIRDWWMSTAERDIDAMLPKMREYSATDLQVVGAALAPTLPVGLQIESGIAFYALGKTARLVGSFREGREPHVDSWDDLGVYSFMGRYAREFGRWP